MRHADLFIITEAQRKAQAFENEVARVQLLAQLPKAKSWRYRTAERLLRLAARLEPHAEPETTRSTC